MAKVVTSGGPTACGPGEVPGWFEIHFSNVREIEPDTNLTVRLPVEVARQLVDLINATLLQG